MSDNNNKQTSYTVYEFMSEELKLSGGELAVFAIIYSFSNKKQGLFYGSRSYLTKASGMSLSTVKRAITSLVRKGYIEKCQQNDRNGYRSIIDKRPPTEPLPRETESDEEYFLPPPHIMVDLGHDLSYYIDPDEDAIPKYRQYPVGPGKLVTMTAEQYKSLLRLVAPEELRGYIIRLEHHILEDGYQVHNAYKTIRDWIVKDAAV